MILIGVSGSTKCDWQLIRSESETKSFSTRGLSPLFHSEEEIFDIISGVTELQGVKPEVIYIYSAGCGSKSFRHVVLRAVSRAFPKSNYYVNHDIVASALATYEGVPSISCILGTGSNACYFDGDIVRQETPALDYVLGDEGGGSGFGKKLLSDYLYKLLPQDLSAAFTAEYGLTKEEILESVYQKPYPNVYLASYMTFIQKHKDHEYCRQILRDGFNEFFQLYVERINKYESLTVHFTGSIAFFFEEELRSVANDRGINVGKIIKEPISDLVKYHMKKIYN